MSFDAQKATHGAIDLAQFKSNIAALARGVIVVDNRLIRTGKQRADEIEFLNTIRDEKDASCSWNEAKGLFNDKGDPDFDGDLIHFVCRIDGLNLVQAVEQISFETGVEIPYLDRPGSVPKNLNLMPRSGAIERLSAYGGSSADERQSKRSAEQRRKIIQAQKIWDCAAPAVGTLAEEYLRARCIPSDLAAEPNLRYAEALPFKVREENPERYPVVGSYPTLVAAARVANQGAVRAVVLIRFSSNADGSINTRPTFIHPETGEEIKRKKEIRGAMKPAGVFFGPAITDTIVACEGVEDALCAASRGYAAVAAMGTNLANVQMPSHVKTVILAGDRDSAGQKGIRNAADAFMAQGLEVRIANIPNIRVQISGHEVQAKDFNDLMFGGQHAEIDRILIQAKHWQPGNEDADDGGPKPLLGPIEKATPFPIDAMGGVLADAANAIVQLTQADPAIAGQSVLAAANLAAQDCVDVLMPRGGDTPDVGNVVPISEYFLAVGTTGTRKTSTDRLALEPHRTVEKVQRVKHEEKLKRYKAERGAYEMAKKNVERNLKTADQNAITQALMQLEEPPLPPDPQLIYDNVTTQGLFKALKNNEPRAGLFSDDAGKFFGGYSMTEEQKTATFANFNNAWDGRDIQRVLASEEKTILRGVRLCMCLMAQPKIIEKFLGDSVAADQGFHARFLITAPDPHTVARVWKGAPCSAARLLEVYSEAIKAALNEPREFDDDGSPRRRVMQLSDNAFDQHKELYNRVQAQLVRYGSLLPVGGLAEKTHEHACRLAATLQFIEAPKSNEISGDNYASAVELMRHYVSEALRLLFQRLPDELTQKADVLRNWLQAKLAEGHDEIKLRDVAHGGPRGVRGKNEFALRVIAVLVGTGHLKVLEPKKRWLIMPAAA